METKKCAKCGEVKSTDSFANRTRKRKDGTTYTELHCYCRKCRNKIVDDYRRTNKAARQRKNKTDSARRKARRRLDPEYDEFLRKRSRETNAREARELSNVYVKRILVSRSELSCEEVTPELIGLKRKQLKLYRDVKNKTTK